ncbi:MAG: S9 family peptidase [Rickettsiaceae bacterium]
MKLEINKPVPIAKQVKYQFELHNQIIEDNYAWLRSKEWPNKITNTEILNYLNEENDYYHSFMQPLDQQKEDLFEELKGRIQLTDQSTYVKHNDYYYYTRTKEDQDYTIYCRKKGSTTATEEILLDVNKLAQNRSFVSIGAFSVSPDDQLLAYSVDYTGGEKYTIKVLEITSQTYIDSEITDTIGAIIWHENQTGFFYTPTDEQWRHNKVKFHLLGSDNQQDQLVFHEPNNLYSVNVSKSSSRQYIFVHVEGHDSNEIYFINLNNDNFTPTLITTRKDQVHYSIDHNDKYFYQHTNDSAKNCHILRAPDQNYTIEDKWEIYIAESKDKYLSSFDLTKDFLLMNYQLMGTPELVVKQISTGSEQKINFSDSSYTASIYSTNFDENDIRANYSSLAKPSTVYSYNFDNNKLNVLKTQTIPSGFDSEEYQVEKLLIKTDGVEVPVSLLYKKSFFNKDGTNPLYLYGYGSYGISIAPSFRNSAISLVNRGFVFAISHIRGGDDLGYHWYEAAKFLQKKRTFNDFIATADALIQQNYTSSGNIAIAGGSAGGMLIGNVINQRPELFKAAIAHVPFVDVLNTMLDDTLPLTPGEYKEWGNPQDNEYFDYIKSYSPYDNIAASNYPHLFVTAGLSDPRVGYWEAAKWVAKLRQYNIGNNLILYKTNMEFGHQGASARLDYLKESAEELAFLTKIFNRT